MNQEENTNNGEKYLPKRFWRFSPNLARVSVNVKIIKFFLVIKITNVNGQHNVFIRYVLMGSWNVEICDLVVNVSAQYSAPNSSVNNAFCKIPTIFYTLIIVISHKSVQVFFLVFTAIFGVKRRNLVKFILP